MGGRARHRQRRGVLHRLGRPAAQSAQPVRARRSSTSPTSAARAAAASSSSCTPAPAEGLDVFGSFGYTRARFDDGTMSSGVDVSGNELPNTPDYTFTVGAQLSRALTADDHVLRPRRSDGVRVVPLRRPEPGVAGGLFARQLPRGRAWRARCSPRSGSRTRSTPTTFRSRSRTRALRRRASSARAAGRGHSA